MWLGNNNYINNQLTDINIRQSSKIMNIHKYIITKFMIRIILVNFHFHFFFCFQYFKFVLLTYQHHIQISIVGDFNSFSIFDFRFTLSRERRWENEFFLHGSSTSLWQKRPRYVFIHSVSSFLLGTEEKISPAWWNPSPPEPPCHPMHTADSFFPLASMSNRCAFFPRGGRRVFRAKLNV